MINPEGMTWKSWAEAVILVVRDVWSYGVPPDEERWRDWAVAFARAPGFARQVIPDPYQFADWREWAMRVYPMLEPTPT